MEKKVTLDRRRFIAGIGVAGMVTAGALAGCSNSNKPAPANTTERAWDKEVDLVVVGSGTGLFGALMAQHENASVVVLEKGKIIGGTTSLSGNGCWVPRNRHMAEHGIKELSDQEIVDYINACDAFKSAPQGLQENYVTRAHKVFDYIEDEFGLYLTTDYDDPKFDGKVVRGDYYPLPGNLPLGRSLFFCNAEGVPYYSNNYKESVIPYTESVGLEILTETAGKTLVTDESGAVVGIEAEDASGKSLSIKANKGVILAAGGFDYNLEMTHKYLRSPVYGSNAVHENTGDAHAMGMAVGAALGNMASMWGLPFFKVASGDEYSPLFDWSTYRTKPYSLIVNRKGRRFCSESSAYSIINLAFASFDSGTCTYLNLPAFFIFDANYVANYGFPGQKLKEGESPTLPEYVQEFSSLEDLANGMGIDASALTEEVSRFNGFAATGIDADWKRGEYFHEYRTNGDLKATGKGLSNNCLGPVEAAPFYVAEIGPGTCGTNGGLLVNTESQVLRPDGSVIQGLYAAGNSTASIFGTGYPGAGGTVAPGIFQAMMAVQNALSLERF